MASQDDPNWGKFLSYGLEILAGVLLGVVVGSWIDRKWHTAPWGLMFSTMAGVAAGMYLLIKDALKINKD